MNYSLFDDVLKRREEGRSRKEKTTGSHIRLPPQKYGSRPPLIMLAVTDYQHCVETQDRRLEDPETGSAPPSYVSDMVKDWVIGFGVRGLLLCIYPLHR
jgi:hypothetical protein